MAPIDIIYGFLKAFDRQNAEVKKLADHIGALDKVIADVIEGLRLVAGINGVPARLNHDATTVYFQVPWGMAEIEVRAADRFSVRIKRRMPDSDQNIMPSQAVLLYEAREVYETNAIDATEMMAFIARFILLDLGMKAILADQHPSERRLGHPRRDAAAARAAPSLSRMSIGQEEGAPLPVSKTANDPVRAVAGQVGS